MDKVILGLLIFRSLTAYDISCAFKEGISQFYSASYGSIQVALKKLYEKGFITYKEGIHNGRNRKTYSICDSGKSHFLQWMTTPISKRNSESIISTKVYFLGLIKDDIDKKSIIEDIISIYTTNMEELLMIQGETSKLEIEPPYKEIFKYQMVSLEHGLAEYEASIKFFTKLLDNFK